MVGGVPSALPNFGSAYNPESIITPHEMFDLIDGGGLDATCLEADLTPPAWESVRSMRTETIT